VLVVGAGDMGEGIAVALVGAGATDITVISRTSERAEQLASRVGGRIEPMAELASAMAHTDVLLTCTGAGSVIIDREMLTAARSDVDAPLLVVDIAVPRDVAADVVTLPGVTVLNLDDLRDWAAQGVAHRQAEADHVRSIVSEEVERFTIEVTARQAAPLVAQLHEKAEAVRQAEIERFGNRLAALPAAQREAVEALTKGIVAKLLHQVSVRLKDDAGTPQGERNAAAVRDLFDIG
jgi:glutamyl-tRNA reductase